MNKVDIDVEGASALFNADIMGYSTYCNVYPWTNEPLGEIYQELCEEKSKVLTVNSSGDHLINAASRGCTDITAFDINTLTMPYLDLKLASIITFDKDRFLTLMPATFDRNEFFYTEYMLGRISLDVYKQLEEIHGINKKECQKKKEERKELLTSRALLENLKNIDKDSYTFWIKLFSKNNDVLDSKLFKLTHCGELSDIIKNTGYLSSYESYEQVRSKISSLNIRKITADIIELPHILKEEKFDFTNLSNIINSGSSSFPNGFYDYSSFLQNGIYPLMNECGTVVVDYFQNPYEITYETFNHMSMQNAFTTTNHEVECLDIEDTKKVYYKTL